MKRRYSLKKIRHYMVGGGILFSGQTLLIILVLCLANGGMSEKSGIMLAVSVLLTAITGLYFFLIYKNLYLPNMQLQKLIEEITTSEGLEYVQEEDMIVAVQEIIQSLDVIAIRQKNAEILMKNAEINNLQDQINPHFLYNTLEVIRGEALIKGEKKIAEMTASLANYFRYNISRKETFVMLKDELKNSMNYFHIQKSRFGEKISFQIEYHGVEEKDVEKLYIPKLILQPVIENAIYHGLELKMEPGSIKVHITATETHLIIQVTDDGLGMTKEKLEQINSESKVNEEDLQERHNGVAIRNIKQRLKLYWGGQAYLYVTSELGMGTQVYIKLPLLREKEEYMNL